MRGVPLQAGAAVSARLAGKGKWLAGVIACVNADGTYAVRYHNGERCARVQGDVG